MLTQRQELMPFPSISGSSSILDSELFNLRASSESLGRIKVLFFGGKSGGAYINTTFQFSTMPKYRVYLPIVVR